MDAKEYTEVFNRHINIANQLFINLPNQQEGKEWAEYAVHIAILTHKKDRSSLSTYVYYVAKKYRNKFIRSYRKWNGIQPCVNKSIQKKYSATHRHIQISGADVLTTLPDNLDIYANEHNLDLIIDIQDIIEQLEQKHKVFRGRLSIIVEEWKAGKKVKEIAKKLGCSRQWISHLKRLFKKKLKHYLTER